MLAHHDVWHPTLSNVADQGKECQGATQTARSQTGNFSEICWTSQSHIQPLRQATHKKNVTDRF